MIQENGAGVRISWSGVVPVPHAVQTLKRVEIGMGLGLGNNAPVNGFTRWDGVAFQGVDRFAGHNTLFRLPREPPRLGLNDGNAPSASCCERSDMLPLVGQPASASTAHAASPTIYLVAILQKKGLDIDLTDGWKLQTGGRTNEYSRTLQTRVGFLSIERFWRSVRASYSFQVERSNDLKLAASQVVLFDFLYGPRDSIGVSYADGREFADFGTLGTLNTEMRSIGVRGQHSFKNDWGFTYQAGHSDHGNLPAYQVIRLGLQRRF